MNYWSELVDAAVLGSGRITPPRPGAGPLAGLAAESDLLDLAAAASRARRAGFLPADASDLHAPEPAPPDDRPVVSSAARRRLVQLINAGELDLVIEWVRLLPPRQVPPGQLPALLTLATSSKRLRDVLVPSFGPLASWLAVVNPAWAWVTTLATEPTAEGWTTAAHTVRRDLVLALRRTDPAAARALVESTWATDSAKDRAAFVAALVTGLGPDDEPLLELALTDRGQDVRRAAADLLSRLPSSAFALRAAARATAAVLVIDGKLVVTPPAQASEDMVADGIVPDPPRPAGRQGWLLRQLAAAAPASAWPGEPAVLLELAIRSDWSQDLLAGWTEAAIRDGSRPWIEALLDRADAQPERDAAAQSARLMAALPEGDLAGWLAAHPDNPLFSAVELVAAPWPPALSAAVWSQIAALIRADREGRQLHAPPVRASKLFKIAATRLEPPELPDVDPAEVGRHLAGGWAELTTTLSVRAAMRRELAEEPAS